MNRAGGIKGVSSKRSHRDDRGRLIDLNQLAAYVNMGRNRAADFGRECGARVMFGGSVRYDREIIDKAIDVMREKQNEGKR